MIAFAFYGLCMAALFIGLIITILVYVYLSALDEVLDSKEDTK